MKTWMNAQMQELNINETAFGGVNWDKPDNNYIQDGLAYTTYDPVAQQS